MFPMVLMFLMSLMFVLQCSQDVVSAGIQYVQPVAVVPVGQPVPAVQAGGHHHQYTVPLTAASPDLITNRDITVGSFGSPTQSFGPPQSSYNPPTSGSVQTSGYRGPKQSGLTSKVDSIDLYQTTFSAGQPEPSRPVRAGRLEECYCVPVAQCPAHKIMGNIPQKDYSALINPRVKNKYIPAGRSALQDQSQLEASGEETTDLAEDVTEVNTEISRKKRQNEESEEQPAETVRDLFRRKVVSFHFFIFSLDCPTPSQLRAVFPPPPDWPQTTWN